MLMCLVHNLFSGAQASIWDGGCWKSQKERNGAPLIDCFNLSCCFVLCYGEEVPYIKMEETEADVTEILYIDEERSTIVGLDISGISFCCIYSCNGFVNISFYTVNFVVIYFLVLSPCWTTAKLFQDFVQSCTVKSFVHNLLRCHIRVVFLVNITIIGKAKCLKHLTWSGESLTVILLWGWELNLSEMLIPFKRIAKILPNSIHCYLLTSLNVYCKQLPKTCSLV